jgi:hypothetical protein
MTNLPACSLCTAPAPTGRIITEPWCCSVACFRTFQHIAASSAPAHKEVTATA